MSIFMVQIKRQSKGGEMTQLVKGSLEKHEDVRAQSPRIHIKGWMRQYIPIIPTPGRDRREDPWCSLGSLAELARPRSP